MAAPHPPGGAPPPPPGAKPDMGKKSNMGKAPSMMGAGGKKSTLGRKSLAGRASRMSRMTSNMGYAGGGKSMMGAGGAAPKVYRQPSYWDAQGGGFQAKRRGEGKGNQAVGFKGVKAKDRTQLRPQWATKMIEAGLDPMMAIQGLTTDEVAAYLEDEGQMYQLTEGEITQLKHLVELQLLLEADPEIGVIEGADEVLNLMARLAGVGGDLTELHPADQAAILSLIQFNNVVPGFGPMFDEDQIEAQVEGANNFVQYTDHTGTPVFIRKGSYVKAQILERKIEGEISSYENFNKLCFFATIGLIAAYIIIKILVFVMAVALTGSADGYDQALQRVDKINSKA